MATLYLTCGLQGSGKTTWARQLEREAAAIRLTADEWLHDLHPDLRGDELDARRGPVEQVQWAVAVRVLELGCNVVLDWGLWSREERDFYRSEAQRHGAEVVLCLLDPPLDELRARLVARNADIPRGTFEITAEAVARADHLFQRPVSAERQLFDAVCERHASHLDMVTRARDV